MEFLGIGLQELFFIGLILILVLGPTELVTLGRRAGQTVRKIRNSETWVMIANLASALRNLPNALADEARAEEIFRDVVPNRDRRTIAPPDRDRPASRPHPAGSGNAASSGYSAWTTPPADEPGPGEPMPEDRPPPANLKQESDQPDAQ
jgi:hypothetical protein